MFLIGMFLVVSCFRDTLTAGVAESAVMIDTVRSVVLGLGMLRKERRASISAERVKLRTCEREFGAMREPGQKLTRYR